MDNEEIPWDAMKFMTGQINYGGRVTDDLDRQCLLETLTRVYNEDVMNEDFSFSESGRYLLPKEFDIKSIHKHI